MPIQIRRFVCTLSLLLVIYVGNLGECSSFRFFVHSNDGHFLYLHRNLAHTLQSGGDLRLRIGWECHKRRSGFYLNFPFSLNSKTWISIVYSWFCLFAKWQIPFQLCRISLNELIIRKFSNNNFTQKKSLASFNIIDMSYQSYAIRSSVSWKVWRSGSFDHVQSERNILKIVKCKNKTSGK